MQKVLFNVIIARPFLLSGSKSSIC